MEIEVPESRGLRCFVKLDHPVGVEIRCRKGAAWVTQEGDPRDHVLAPGEAIRFARAGRVLVSAVGACTCEIRSQDEQPMLLAVERPRT